MDQITETIARALERVVAKEISLEFGAAEAWSLDLADIHGFEYKTVNQRHCDRIVRACREAEEDLLDLVNHHDSESIETAWNHLINMREAGVGVAALKATWALIRCCEREVERRTEHERDVAEATGRWLRGETSA